MSTLHRTVMLLGYERPSCLVEYCPDRPQQGLWLFTGSWVAWKQPGDKAAAGGDLFVAKAHYNLLRPQRPSSV